MTNTTTIKVELEGNAYDIVVGEDLLAHGAEFIAPLEPYARLAVVSDEAVATLHLPALCGALDKAGLEHSEIVLPAGEASKSFNHFEGLVEDLLRAKTERGDAIIALGGGVIGDLAGFAAAVLRRGVDVIQIPTTLLAQVDSSVGGKTAINSPQGKNLIGVFHQPRLVLADIALLDTLSPRELRAGYAEVVKYGLIDDGEFFNWLEKAGPALLEGDREARQRAVVASCRAKARFVAEDEREQGRRALLNLGHTFGHALEAEMGYGDGLLHGEGVAVGMCLAFDLSVRMGHCDAAEAVRLRAHLKACGLPTSVADIPGAAQLGGWRAERLLEHMRQDKKVRDGRLTFILARGIGETFIANEVDEGEILATLEADIGAA